mgnify:CR=1 FL=1
MHFLAKSALFTKNASKSWKKPITSKPLIQLLPGARHFGPEVRKVWFLLTFNKKCGISRFWPPRTYHFPRETGTFQKWTILEQLLRKIVKIMKLWEFTEIIVPKPLLFPFAKRFGKIYDFLEIPENGIIHKKLLVKCVNSLGKC